jgi:putative sterol carrier protein
MNAQIETIISEMGKRIGAKSGLGGTMKFDFGADGSVFIDGASEPNAVSSGDGKSADCTITLSLETFQRLVTRTLDPTIAFMQGKLKVAGDMGLAMKLAPLLGRG